MNSHTPQKIRDRTTIFSRDLLKSAGAVVGGAALLSLAAPLTFALPGTPIPLVLQNTLVLLVGLMLGSRLGALAVMLFLAEAACGMPVLSFCRGGLAHFLSPTGGYLAGYIAGAYVTGLVYEKMKSRFSALLALFAGNAVTYLFGVAWLANYLGLQGAYMAGAVPFMVTDSAKILFSVGVLSLIHKRRSSL